MSDKIIPPRPSCRSDEVIGLAVEGIIKSVFVWLDDPQYDRGEVRNDLVKHFDENGFTYASNLARREGWECDADLVDILDNASTFDAHDRFVAEWVKLHRITVPFSVGDLVCHRQVAKGTVVKIRAKTAQIVVQPVDGENKFKGTDGGVILDIEDVIPIIGTLGDKQVAA